MSEPDQQTIEAWAALLRLSRGLMEVIESKLKQAGLPPLVWYDVLHELAGVGKDGLRPFELIERMLLAQYNTSRLLARMQEQGVIERAPCPADGRGQIVRITPAGRDMRRRMWAVYGPAIARHFGDVLGYRDMRELSRLLNRVNGERTAIESDL